MKSGDRVAVTENFRSKGVVGGWKPFTWYGRVIRVNRATVDIKRDYSNFLSIHRIKKEKVEVIDETQGTV